MKTLFQACKDLLFPACCLNCGRQLSLWQLPLFCRHCMSDISSISSPLCPCCGSPFPSGEDHHCGICLNNGFAFDRARSIFLYREPLNSLLAQFKFGGKLSCLDSLAALAELADTESLLREPDIILPVPLHIQRLRDRGFNQSLLLARSCLPEWKNKIRTDLLLRHKPTVPQTSLNGKARRDNLKGAFSIKRLKEITGKTVLIVDDVFTTGSTVHECAKVLRKAGARRIEVFTLARAM